MNLTSIATAIWEFLTRDIAFWGGLHSPVLSWLGACAMTLYFAWHVSRLIHGVMGTARAFHRIRQDLAELADTRRRLYGESQWLKARMPGGAQRTRAGTAALTCTDLDDVQKLDKTLQQEPLFQQPWAQYRKTLVVERVPWFVEPRIFSTYPAAEFFSQETLFAGRLNLAFYHQLPSLMTGIGLLLTFVAILVGLSKLHAEGAIIVGIDGLINGLAGKFLTSIVGLICANLFVMIEHRVVARLNHLHLELLDIIDELFPRKTLEQMVENLALPAEGDRTAVARPSADLGDGWIQASADRLSPAVAALTAAVRSLNALKTDDRPPVDLHITDEMAKVLRDGLEPKITDLSESIRKLIGSLEDSKTLQKEQQARLDTVLSRLSRTLETSTALQPPRPDRPPIAKLLTSPDGAAPRTPKPASLTGPEPKVAPPVASKTRPDRTATVASQPLRPFSTSKP
jgi:hypothetical protein